MSDSHKKFTYQDAGVNITAGNALVESIKADAKATRRKGVLGGLGGFGALFELPWQDYQQPVLVSGTDGVGSKLLLAKGAQTFDTIGIDLVAMCANDIIVCGSEPLFFLDYYATGHLEVAQASAIIKGIAAGCLQANIALIGGETAELPGLYGKGDYDLAGFCVGIVEKANILDGRQIQAGDALIALPSSGPHANGYSLIRQLIDHHKIDLNQSAPFAPAHTLLEILLAPTRIYVKTIRALLETQPVKAMAHITGGGLTENIPRVLPQGLSAQIDLSSWSMPPVFQWLRSLGHIEPGELLRTFNCGVGMILCIGADQVTTCLAQLADLGEKAWQIGHITATGGDQNPTVIYSD